MMPFFIQTDFTKPQKLSLHEMSPTSSNETSIFDDGSKKCGKWTAEEDELLLNAVSIYGTKNWKLVSKAVAGRNQVQCLHRWTKILQPGLTKGPWSAEEDRKLMEWVKREGPNKWTSCAAYIKGRSGKQCRERWLNTLNPTVKKGNWTIEEDFMIFKLFTQFGSQWSKINLYFNSRTENSVKNRFYSTLRRIAAERRKESGIIEPKTNSKTKLDSLLQFVPDAIREKSMKLSQINENHDLLHIPQMSTSAHSTQNIYVEETIDFKQQIHTKEEERINKMPLKQIEDELDIKCDHAAENQVFNDYGIFHDDENGGFLDHQVSNFIDNFFENSNEEKDCAFSFLHNNKIDFDEGDCNLNSMVQQLSTLEELLHNTKKQILTGSNFSV